VLDEKNNDISLKVLPKKSHFKLRWVVLLTVQLLIIIHIVLWVLGNHFDWFGGKTLAPIEPSEGMEFVKNGVVNTGAIFFALALLSTLLFGRWFCGWGCHIILLQDWCYSIMRKCGIRPKPFRSRFLMWFPFVLAMYMYIWPLVYRFAIARLPFPSIRSEFLTEDYWGTFASPIVAVPFLFICGFATVYVLGAKGFCTYGCPYGGFFKPFDKASPMRVRVNENCGQCGKCTAACTSNIRVNEEVKLHGMVIDSGCMKIMDCIDACPNDALSIGFGSNAILKRTNRRSYDLTFAEELFISIIFVLGFFAFRSLYAIIPMLMAVGMSLVTTWSIWKTWKVLSLTNVRFHKIQLKLHGKTSRSGMVFIFLGLTMFLFLMHSVTIQSLIGLGNYASAKGETNRALSYYKISSPIQDGGIAFASNPNVDRIVARHHDDELQFEEALRLYRRIDARVGQDEVSTMLIGQNLQYHAQFSPIQDHYAKRLELNPHWELVWEDYIGWLKREGSYQDAIAASKVAVKHNPKSKRLRIQWALLESEFGNSEEAVYLASILVQDYVNDPAMWMLLSRTLDKNGQREKSLQAMDQAKKIQKNKKQEK